MVHVKNSAICRLAYSKAYMAIFVEFFVCYVEVIFLIVDRVHAGLLCLHHIAFAWFSLIYFCAEQIILVKCFFNTSESSKRINQFGFTEHVATCMLITYLSFSDRAHTKEIRP